MSEGSRQPPGTAGSRPPAGGPAGRPAQRPAAAPGGPTRPAAPQPARAGGQAGYSPFPPLLLVILVLLTIIATQLYERVGQRVSLQEFVASQQEPLQEAQRTRAQFDGLVNGTARLAAAGNPNAQRIQADLQRLGIRTNTSP